MEMDIKYFDNQESFIKSINKKNIKYFLLIASNTKISLNNFNKNNIEIVGAVFPQIIFKNKLFEKGLICIEVDSSMNLHFIENIKDYKFSENKFLHAKSIITILDGFSKYNEEFLSELFENVDVNTNIIGGGTGLLENRSKATLFNNEGFYNNSAVLLTLNSEINIGSKHGWDYLDGPFIATSSEKNILKTIDYIDAFEHYKKIVKKDCGLDITKENFLEISKNYPLGIVKYKGEEIVRDPVSYENGNLILIGEITENSVINVLRGNKDNLLSAVEFAAEDVLKKHCDITMIFTCISRKNFLEENFEDELNIIFEKSKSSTIIGVVTVGEIANNGNRYISFLNKTCVIGGICF